VTEGILEQPTAEAEDNHVKMKLRRKYAGEALTELGVLIFFFLPLESILQHTEHWPEASALGFLFGVGLTLWGIHLQVEGR
jgi:hypothetical protein